MSRLQAAAIEIIEQYGKDKGVSGFIETLEVMACDRGIKPMSDERIALDIIMRAGRAMFAPAMVPA